MITIDVSKILRWSKGSCGNSGCKDESCVCGACGPWYGRSAGVPEIKLP
jgi:hypothetical protein